MFNLDDYVMVMAVPDAWDASEEFEDRLCLVGHVGTVVDLPANPEDGDELYVVRFPTHDCQQPWFQRTIEATCLKWISKPAYSRITQPQLDQM